MTRQLTIVQKQIYISAETKWKKREYDYLVCCSSKYFGSKKSDFILHCFPLKKKVDLLPFQLKNQDAEWIIVNELSGHTAWCIDGPNIKVKLVNDS